MRIKLNNLTNNRKSQMNSNNQKYIKLKNCIYYNKYGLVQTLTVY